MIPRRGLSLLPLIAATYFIVSGGPYGLEELVQGAGYPLALAALVIVPLVWAIPTALLVGELAAALPAEGGYYVWVRRGLGDFWGVQEAWLSLLASIFDMGIYPTLFVTYLARLWPAAGGGSAGLLLGAGLIMLCALWNLRSSREVGVSAVVLGTAMLLPFLLLAAFGLGQGRHTPVSGGDGDLLAGLLVAMWNTMGFDNASTFAAEVERPQTTYPRAMLGAVGLVALTYLVPVAVAWHIGFPASGFAGGAWVEVARQVGGPALATALVLGGMISVTGTFSALVLSYSRVPLALARDGYLPAWLGRTAKRTGAPVAAVAVLSLFWMLSLGLGFERLVLLDVSLYGLSLLLEFIALWVLRVREPNLPRPFRIPGGQLGIAVLGLPPMLLLAAAFYRERGATLFGISAVIPLGVLVALGAPLYWAGNYRKRAMAGPAAVTPAVTR